MKHVQGSGRDSGNWRVMLGGIWAMIPKLILESHVWQELSQSQGKPCATAGGARDHGSCGEWHEGKL